MAAMMIVSHVVTQLRARRTLIQHVEKVYLLQKLAERIENKPFSRMPISVGIQINVT